MYSLIYGGNDGKVIAIKRLSDGAMIPLAEDNTDYQNFCVWNSLRTAPLDLNLIDQSVIDAHKALIAAQSARAQAIIDNLPPWADIETMFNTLTAELQASTNLTQAKAVVLKLVNVVQKATRVEYWLAKNRGGLINVRCNF